MKLLTFPNPSRFSSTAKCIALALAFTVSPAFSATGDPVPEGWKLAWSDEFEKSGFIDPEKWSKCERGGSDWNNMMTDNPRCYVVRGGRLQLRGFVNKKAKGDEPKFMTGGLTSKGKFEFQHGKIEIRARLKTAKGAWPALWLLGAKGGWPGNGEMDLMERLNSDDFVYQTTHSEYTVNIDKTDTPPKSKTTKVDPEKFNTYGAEWDSEKITYTVNGEPTLIYPRIPEKGEKQWPFDQPFYIIMSMQIEGAWVGKADPKDYPAGMEIDWVRVYEREEK